MQTIKLNLIPGGVLPVVNISQYDVGRHFAIQIYEGAASYDLTGKSVQIRGTKPDGNGFAYDSTDGVVSVNGSTVTISTTQQMTAVGGNTTAELRITSGTTIIGTLNFILAVENSALSDDTPISDTEIPAIERQLEAVLEEVEGYAEDAESWAVGKRDGQDVPSTDPAYQNNAKYYAGDAESDALKAEGYGVGEQNGVPVTSGSPYYNFNANYFNGQANQSRLTSEGYAIGRQNGVPVTSGSPYYHNNSLYFSLNAEDSATNARQSATNAGLSETAAGNSATSAAADALKSEGWAVGEQNGTPVTSGSPYYHNNAEYYKDQAAQYAAGGLIFKGSVAFASIPTTGMVNGDMYNITDDFTTDNRFIEGSGVSVKAGADIAWIDSVSKWDILALGGGTDSLSGLQDVTLTSPASGQVLEYDGSKWVNGNGGGGGGGFDYKDWLTAGDLNPMSYADLAAVLADEKAVRKLMTIHLAVDYLAGQTAVDASVNTILTDNTCAKWINLRDYALDTLYDNALFATIMDASGKYFLGEWAKLSESPETWGPKGNVPIMTSNTAPYGVASAYQVFDGNNATTASGTDFNYKFVNPVCVKDFVVKDGSGNAITGGTLQASNDGSTWVTPVADTFYMAWNVHFGSSTTVGTVQFYGREMKVSVPAMTSGTAPYGVVSSSSVESSSFPAYNAFKGLSDTTNWRSLGSASEAWIQYQFVNPIVISKIEYKNGSSLFKQGQFKLQGSNDGTSFTDLIVFDNTTNNTLESADVYTQNAYKYLRVRTITGNMTGGTYYTQFTAIQFYGFDYSEYDWDADNPRHYLYDHGVEVETISAYVSDQAKASVTKNDYSIKVYKGAYASTVARIVSPQINLSAYDKLFWKIADEYLNNGANTPYIGVSSTNPTNTIASLDLGFEAAQAPLLYTTRYLNISSVSVNAYIIAQAQNGSGVSVVVYAAINEMWLE